MLPRVTTTIKCLWGATLLACCLQPVCLYAQKVGDVVFCIRSTPIKDGDKVIGTFREGQTSDIQDINGNWYWIAQEAAGWVRRQDVLTLDEAVKYYTDKIRQDPTNADWYYARGTAWTEKEEWDIALADLNEAIRIDPQWDIAWSARGQIWDDKGDFDKAIADFTQAITLKQDPFTFMNRGRSWAQKENYDKAVADFDQAIRMKPDDIGAFGWRGYSWWQLGKYDKAVADLNEAIRLDSKYGFALSTLAAVEASCPDESYRNGKQAVEHAKQACELSAWKDLTAIDALARAYAEVGDFDHAIEYQNKTLALRTWKPKEGQKDWHHYRLELYQQKKPYRFDPNA